MPIVSSERNERAHQEPGAPATGGEVHARVRREVDRLVPAMVETLAELVRVESVNPKYPGQVYDELVGREGEVTARVAERYEDAGAEVVRFAVEPGRENAAGVVRGSGGGRSLAFNAHVDVVPAGDPAWWTQGPPFCGRVTDDRVVGRGSADAKGGLVAHVFAAIALRAAGVRLAGDLVLQAVVGEEMGDHACGTSAVAERGFVADAAVVCEPTSLGAGPTVVPVSPGLLWFSVTVTGRQAHSGLRGLTVHPTLEGSRLGVNAVDKGFLLYEAIRRLEDEWAETKRHPLFAPGYFGILPGVVQGGPTGVLVPFSLADSMTIEYCAYHDPRDDAASAKREIEERIRLAASLDPWLREHPPVVTWKLEWPPTGIDPDAPICQSARRAHDRAAAGTAFETPARTSGFLGVCDTTWLAARGVPSLVYGPGDLTAAHAADESVRIDEVALACRAYAALALDWCGVAAAP